VGDCLLCWFIALFIQIIASLVSLSTLLTSASTKWSYCSSWRVRSKTGQMLKMLKVLRLEASTSQKYRYFGEEACISGTSQSQS